MTKQDDVILFFMPEWGGFHLAGWREPEAPHDPPMNFEAIRQMVQTAERGKFHGFFLADSAGGWRAQPSALSRTARAVRAEPITLMSALTAYTRNIGLLCTVNTSYSQPYNVARLFASIDHLSGGRAGWNVVTGHLRREAANFGFGGVPDHAQRYARAEEFLEVVTGLWDSWEDDAFVCDRESGVFFDPDRLHALGFRGEHLSVAGPLNIARPVQGHPVVAQAGSSPAGRALAARSADVVYTLQADLEKAKAFYAEVKAQVAENGRAPEHVKVLPGLLLVLGRTQAEADEKLARLDSLVDPAVGMGQVEETIGVDLSGLALDGPVPDIPETERGSKGGQRFFLDRAKRENLTVRQLMQVVARVGAVARTSASVADEIQEWVQGGAADGFNITFADASNSLELFVDEVIPELQRRNLFQREYRGRTLRENLGIPRPANRFVTPPA